MVYRLKNIERADTIFDGLAVIVRDSLDVPDTADVTDTVQVEQIINE
jgi:hypothetical protein